MAHPTRHAGFTLTELMVTLGVLAVMVAVSIPSVLAWMPSIHLKNAAYDVKDSMIQARSRAINTSIEHRVLFDPTNNTYQVDRGNLSSGSTTWTAVVGPYALQNGITFSTFTSGMEAAGSDRLLRFSVRGGVVTNLDVLSVTVTNEKSDTYKVSVQRRTGHPSLMKGG
jgi:prepilin-type N-terminal cleavage/methylation domain-containing protein